MKRAYFLCDFDLQPTLLAAFECWDEGDEETINDIETRKWMDNPMGESGWSSIR